MLFCLRVLWACPRGMTCLRALSCFTELSTFSLLANTYLSRMMLGGSSTTMSVAPAIIGGHTMIPLRFVAENLGCLIGWDQGTRSVTVVYGG